MKKLIPAFAIFACAACTGQSEPAQDVAANLVPGDFAADVWVDNWFSMSMNGKQVAEDSVPITTERSFNAESFTFSAERPFVIGLTAKDYKENDSGLEYIGTNRQQIGDGGAIVQIRDSTGGVVAVSNEGWKCLVTHHAPADASCVDESDPVAGVGACAFETTDVPVGWDTMDFDASGWSAATVHSKDEVSPKGGYDAITWDGAAEFIWGPDLKSDNTVLCRLVVE